jgi:hypothetical protein
VSREYFSIIFNVKNVRTILDKIWYSFIYVITYRRATLVVAIVASSRLKTVKTLPELKLNKITILIHRYVTFDLDG